MKICNPVTKLYDGLASITKNNRSTYVYTIFCQFNQSFIIEKVETAFCYVIRHWLNGMFEIYDVNTFAFEIKFVKFRCVPFLFPIHLACKLRPWTSLVCDFESSILVWAIGVSVFIIDIVLCEVKRKRERSISHIRAQKISFTETIVVLAHCKHD